MKIKIFWFYSILLLLCVTAPVRMVAQWPDWPVPEEEAAVLNPVEKSPGALNNGRVLYTTQCAACHGSRGLGDGAIAAPAMNTDAFAAQSDGALFWKLQQGRGQMPSFAQLPADQLWEVIHYIRTFARPLETIARKRAALRLELVGADENRKALVTAWEITDDGGKIPLRNVRIGLGVKRMFGVLPLSAQPLFTDGNGRVQALFPDDLPSDTTGHVTITAFIDDPMYEATVAEEQAPWGKAWEIVDITQLRTLWGTMSSVPLWLLFAFVGIAGAIWLTILWVMLQVKKIRDLGKAAG